MAHVGIWNVISWRNVRCRRDPLTFPWSRSWDPPGRGMLSIPKGKEHFWSCFGWSMSPPPHIPVLKLYPCRRWGLGEIIRIRWHHEGGVLMRGISGLRRVMRELAASLLCHVRRPGEAGGLQPKRGPSPCWHLISEFWPPGLWEMDWCLEAIPALIFLYGSWS